MNITKEIKSKKSPMPSDVVSTNPKTGIPPQACGAARRTIYRHCNMTKEFMEHFGDLKVGKRCCKGINTSNGTANICSDYSECGLCFKLAKFKKGASKESDVEVRELDSTEVPDTLKPFYMQTT